MTAYNPEIHHRRSIRLKGFDYSQAGAYFITICTHEREYLFGSIENSGMGSMICNLNEFGEIAKCEWLKTSIMRPNIQLGEYIIMPNHIHGIIVIDDHRRGTMHRAPTETHRAPAIYEQFGKPTSNTIPTIIRGFKSAVTKQINMLRNTMSAPVWQRNYYEQVIRDEEAYSKIQEYIRNNEVNWEKDGYYR